ncbi:MAG TPA: hypothetical protein VFL80_04215 [Thermoanaerobaculia bacterium]|nr:hypothetical protein [Thermoanaerobaculia bacterium]
MLCRWALAGAALALAGACVTGPAPQTRAIPADWLTVESASRLDTLSYDRSGVLTFLPRQRDNAGVELVAIPAGEKLVRNGRDLTPLFPKIDSFDVSKDRGEVAFSARRETGFDIALVSLDGGDVKWMPSDPADELDVQWAPRGHKISYVIRGRAGDAVRSLHIPTAAQLVVAFPYGRVRALAWEPRAERYAVAYETPEASPRVEIATYSGSERVVSIPPKIDTKMTVEPGPAGSVVLRPEALRYGERLPVVLWRSDDLLRWNDARGELLRKARVAAIVVTSEAQATEVYGQLDEIAWADRTRLFSVGVEPPAADVTAFRGSALARAGESVQQGRVISVPPAVVESFAAGYIAEQLKEVSPQHGRR